MSVVEADGPWAFFAVKGTQWGAPRWVYFDQPGGSPVSDLGDVASHLRRRLAERDSRSLDEHAVNTLAVFLNCLAQAERQLLPRRKQVALTEMREVLSVYERQPDTDAGRLDVVRAALHLLDVPTARRGTTPAELPDDRDEVDLSALADHWLVLVHPTWQSHLRQGGRTKLLRLRDIRVTLKNEPLSTEALTALVTQARRVQPVDERVVSAVVGVAPPASKS